MSNAVNKLSKISLVYHWLVAIGVIGMIAVGWYMANNQVYSLYHLHKSVGLLLFVIIVLRLSWRIKQGWPEPVSEYNKIETIASKVTHYALLIATVLFPITGMIYSGFGGWGFSVFDIVIVAGQYDAAGEVIAHSQYWSEIGRVLHEYTGYSVMFLLALHIIGAFKHHLIDRDRTLLRMLGK
jgi:cytochrome b561